jgi:hypothetical protein
MGLKRASDAIYAFRFLRLLTKDWTDMKAYEMGLVDENGKKLRSPETPEEKNQYTLFHRLVYNLKRTLNLLPGRAARKFGSYASALYLIKEETGIDEDILLEYLAKAGFDTSIEEDTSYRDLQEDGRYQLSHDMVQPMSSLDVEMHKGSIVRVEEELSETIGSLPLYRCTHELSGASVIVSPYDIDTHLQEEVSSAAVTTGDVALPPVPKKTKGGNRFFDFTVPSNVFRRMTRGRKKHQRWKSLLDMNDSNQKQIADFARKYKDAQVVLRDETTGAIQKIRRTSSDGF